MDRFVELLEEERADFPASMLFLESYILDPAIKYQTPCMRNEGRLCNVFADLTRWNEIFWQVGLQLREFSPGQLSLVKMRHKDAHPNRWRPSEKEAATLLANLLSHHRCIVSVHLNDPVFSGHHQIVCDALRESSNLRALKLGPLALVMTNASQSFIAALPHLNQLQELEFSSVSFNRPSLECLSEFLASIRSLTTLTMTDQSIAGDDAIVFLEGLGQNVTISTLSFHISLLSTVSGLDIFTEYLRCNQTLRSLTVASRPSSCAFDLRPIIEALVYNDTISELNLIRFSLDNLNNEIITDMLSRNRGLTKFHLVNCILSISGSTQISSWSTALAKNNTLQELTLDLSWIEPEYYGSFFWALARNTSLKKVNVPTFRQEDVAQICRALQDTKVPERFFIGQHEVRIDTAAKLPECKELSCICVCRSRNEAEPMHTTLRLLPNCNHVRSLCLEIFGPAFNGEAVSKNKSIRRLSLEGLFIDDEEAQILVDTLQSSRTLCHLFFYPYNILENLGLILRLSPIISSNYMLLGLHINWNAYLLGDLYPIADIVRRNNSLVTRGAHFVMGTTHRYCAAAAELMQFNPGLVEMVQELASVDETEAVSRIEDSLKSFIELDDFMRLAGVVKYSVTCHKRDDGRKQLSDLNRDCWLHMRQFLKLGDILHQK
ncbi:hypothetical protein MTO96_046558 [Rhipicephalus appendiculatus]